MPDRFSRNTIAWCAKPSSRQIGVQSSRPRAAVAWRRVTCGLVVALVLAGAAGGTEALLVNPFGDPFVQATRGLDACPVPNPPRLTAAEVREQAHYRAERGTSCHRAGRCRLPNAYLYDREIAERAVRAIEHHGGFADTSVWLEGQRRWVTLKGCVRNAQQATALEQLIRSLDDVEAVINELNVHNPR